MKLHVETFGCQMNTADSEEMGRHLAGRGLSPAASAEEADWILVNTCTVRDHAEHKALSYLGRLKEWKAGRPGRRLVVAGCAAERLKATLRSRFPHVDLVVGAVSIAEFPKLISENFPEAPAALAEYRDAWSSEHDYALWPAAGPTAYVTIMRGCNYSCSYCVVPQVRGREIYRPVESVLAEVRSKAETGRSEVMLLGQTVNSYRPAGAADFADLLRAVDQVPGVRRQRFMGPHPIYMTDRVVRAMAECPSVCPHLHLPVQSGSSEILKRMRRNYTRGGYLDRVAALRAAVPGIAVTTDIIVGFPGETEADFQETLSLIGEADFEGAYGFKYSPRPGTEAAGLPDDVPREVKEERLARVLEATHRLAEKKVAALAGTRQEVLVEGSSEDDGVRLYEGKTRSLWVVKFTSAAPLRVGDTAAVEITEASGRSLRGHALS
ncbi:MAG: tRNA (N6-isopentenyl adenosine(37)-C2)-methylthiotransferase MiaB [Elusimicrobiota bacterium]